MAVKALARQNGADVSIEVDRSLLAKSGREEVRKEAKESDELVHFE